MGAQGFCNVERNECDIRPLHAKVHHLQHQAFVLKKIITLLHSSTTNACKVNVARKILFMPKENCTKYTVDIGCFETAC